jgi:prevent-host-death family protein
MKIVNVHEAKTTLSALLNAVEQGEEVMIARNGVPIARLTSIEDKIDRKPGLLAGQPGWESFVYDARLFAPMTEEQCKEAGWE